MIDIQNVSKIYKMGSTKFRALDGVSLSIKKGEFVAILGASGSGKSTLMHLMGGLDKPTTGSVKVGSIDLGSLKDRQLAKFRNQTIGFVFQFFNLLPNMPALTNVTLPLVYTKKRMSRKKIGQKALVAVGLPAKARNRPSQLSGGEQQRVALARALINKPEIILADEPTGNLDTKNGLQVLKLLSSLNKSGTTVVIVTHDQKIAAYASRVIRMQDGKIV